MLSNDKNLKDSYNGLSVSYRTDDISSGQIFPYKKAEKLITALYMVTDIMAENEPLRNKLRNLGLDVVSDIYSLSVLSSTSQSALASKKISEIISFLNLAATINLISEMNYGILKKEFFILKDILDHLLKGSSLFTGQTNLLKFFEEDKDLSGPSNSGSAEQEYIGHFKPTRIGVQKGKNLMKALSDKILSQEHSFSSFDNLKEKRRLEILSILKDNQHNTQGFKGLTITDIRNKAKGLVASCGEKTLQRELVAMVKSGVLSKTGSKRWSRYSLPK